MGAFFYPPVSLSISSAPISFRDNGIATTVELDHVTPADSTPLPVRQYDSGGNSQDFTEANEAKVSDAGAITELQNILAKIIAAPATEAKQDTVISALGDLLTELQAKADLSETQPVSAASLPLPTGAATETTLASVLAKIIAAPATEAKQDSIISALAPMADKQVLRSIQFSSQAVAQASKFDTTLDLTGAREIEIAYKAGDTLELFDGDTATSLGFVTSGGGKLPLIGKTANLHLQAPNGDVTLTDLTINVIG